MRLYLLIAFALLSLGINAQIPELTSSDKKTPIQLQKLEVAVKILGTRSSTTFTMTFHNPSDKILEGTFLLPLPSGANVTRYALDIDGRMREAVPVEKAKATEVFESVERRKVDPGLFEKTEGNVFRTRIYPIPAHGERSIIIAYEQELLLSSSKELLYNLPLVSKDTLGKFSLSIDIQQRDNAPILQSTPIKDLKLLLDNGRYCTNEHRENIKLETPLSIRIARMDTDVESVVQKKNGEYFFFLQSFLPSSARDKAMPKRITIIWDNSLSGIYRDTKKEQQLLEAYLKRIGTATIHFYTLNNSFQFAGTFSVQNGKSKELSEKLNSIIYDGGTDYSKIRFNQSDETLLFTDGLSTLSDIGKIQNTHPTYTITSSSKSDYSSLKILAESNGGSFVDLQSVSVEGGVLQLAKQQLQFLGMRVNGAISEHYPNTPVTIQNGFSMAGKLSSTATTITLKFGYGKAVAFEKTVQLNYDAYGAEDWDISKLYAQKKIEDLEKNFEHNKDQILLLGKQYSIVTRNTSLLVLEDIMDYVRNEIEPPFELRSEYKRLLKERKEELSQSRTSVLENAIQYSDALRQWWNTTYPVKEKRTTKFTAPTMTTDSAVIAEDGINSEGAEETPPPPPPQQEQLMESRVSNVIVQDEEQTVRRSITGSVSKLEDVVVIGYSSALQGKASGVAITSTGQAGPTNGNKLLIVDGKVATAMPSKDQIKSLEVLEPKAAVGIYGSRAMNGVMIISTKKAHEDDDIEPQIKLDEQTSSATYMKVLAKSPRSHQYKTYLQLRDKNLLNPTFYYDVATFFLKQDKALGMKVLTNLAELDFQNHELHKLFGFKLKELGEKDIALFIFKKVLQWRPQEPQSYRDYALALADKGSYQAALDTLYLALTKEYNENVMENFEGIEETIVTEIAHLTSKYKSIVKTSAINKKLLNSMPVDIRVVMNWNMNDTDMDLWVTDPAGEKCFYSNRETKIGGRMSEDFTEGYGPEQFLLKKAVKGKYKIQVHYYGENSAKIAGKTTLLVEVYTNYARSNEQRKLITLQLEEEEKEGIYVGEFVF